MSKNNSLKKRIFAAILAGTMIMSLSLTGCNNNSKNNSAESKTSETTKSSSESLSSKDIAVKSSNYKISLPIMNYLFNNYYQSCASNQDSGIDTTKDLREQFVPNGENKETWYDYLIDVTEKYIQQILVLAEAARDEKMELDKSDTEKINDSMKSLAATASSNSMSTEDYVEKFCGKGVTQKDVENLMEITALAQKYYKKVYDSYKYTEADYEKYYSENKKKYQYTDFLKYTFSVDTATDATDAEKKDADDKAKAYAEALSKCKTEDEFKQYVKKYLTQNPKLVTSTSSTGSSSGSESSMSDEDVEKAINSAVESTYTKKYAYDENSEAGKWLFDDSRKKLDTTIVDGTNTYTVIMLMKPAYRDESTYKNIRHILLSTQEYGSDEKAKEKADEVYKEWKDGKATEDSFAELAQKYSDDPGSKSNGGLYENVSEGQMVTEFNDWCFDSSRKPGDTGIVKTSYGYHIMYFSGDSLPAWKMSVDAALRSADYLKSYDELKEKYKVDFDEDNVKKIDVIRESSDSSSASTTSKSASE